MFDSYTADDIYNSLSPQEIAHYQSVILSRMGKSRGFTGMDPRKMKERVVQLVTSQQMESFLDLLEDQGVLRIKRGYNKFGDLVQWDLLDKREDADEVLEIISQDPEGFLNGEMTFYE